ncbi:protein rep, partial [Staphylococcus aureus]
MQQNLFYFATEPFLLCNRTGERKLYRVWFCKSRLCPMCNWRRAMKHGIQSQKVVAEVIKQKPTVRWLFLTLTVKNVYDG